MHMIHDKIHEKHKLIHSTNKKMHTKVITKSNHMIHDKINEKHNLIHSTQTKKCMRLYTNKKMHTIFCGKFIINHNDTLISLGYHCGGVFCSIFRVCIFFVWECT